MRLTVGALASGGFPPSRDIWQLLVTVWVTLTGAGDGGWPPAGGIRAATSHPTMCRTPRPGVTSARTGRRVLEH